MLNLSTSTLLSAKQILCQQGGLSYLSRLPARKIAILATKRSHHQYPTLEKIISNKKRFDARIFYPQWQGEPKLSSVKKNIADLLTFQPDWIVAIGGGSVIDGAKVAWGLYENPNFEEARLSVPFSLPELRKKARFVAVPTTAGTGSETSSSALITSEDGLYKIPVVTHDFLPDLAILDPGVLEDIPTKILVPSMLDALSHALEGYVSKVQNTVATHMVPLAVQKLIQAFKKLSEGQDYGDLALVGAYFAGIIQNTNLVGPAHSLAHHIPQIPHGVATGLFTPEVVRIHCHKSTHLKEKYHQLALAVGFTEIDALLDDIYHQTLPLLPIETKVSAFLQLDNRHFLSYAKAAKKDSLSRFFPEDFKEHDFVRILERSY